MGSPKRSQSDLAQGRSGGRPLRSHLDEPASDDTRIQNLPPPPSHPPLTPPPPPPPPPPLLTVKNRRKHGLVIRIALMARSSRLRRRYFGRIAARSWSSRRALAGQACSRFQLVNILLARTPIGTPGHLASRDAALGVFSVAHVSSLTMSAITWHVENPIAG
jgi:hypothetical protein